MSDSESAPVSVAQRIAALNIQTVSAPPQPAAASIKPNANENASTSRIATLRRNVPSATPWKSDEEANNDRWRMKSDEEANNDRSAGEGGGGGGTHYKTEKPKVGRLKPPPAGTAPILVPFGSGPPPPLLLRKQREREERMESLQREATSTNEGEGSAEEVKATRSEIIRSKLPAGAVPTMLPFGPGLPPILLKKQREREERMEEMKREARMIHDDEGGVNDATSPTMDENFDVALLLRPIVKGGQRRPKTRD
jgi:hypothetical protein